MSNRIQKKILITLIFLLAWIVLGTLGYLPGFFTETQMGKSHSIFNPLSIMLDVALYVVFTFVLVTLIFTLTDWLSGRRN